MAVNWKQNPIKQRKYSSGKRNGSKRQCTESGRTLESRDAKHKISRRNSRGKSSKTSSGDSIITKRRSCTRLDRRRQLQHRKKDPKRSREYKLNDLQKIEKVLILYIEKCNKARFEYTSTVEYYILKDKSSRLATDYDNYNEEEINQLSTSSELLIWV